MVTKKHKVLSLILCIMLAVSTVCAGSMAVSAATGDTVYVRANNGWTNLHCYMWTDGASNNAAWPGVAMEKVEDDVYAYTLTGDFKNVIFNNSNNGAGQTGTITYAGDGMIYDLKAGKWSAYDRSDIQVLSYTADSPSTIYTGTAVTLSTTANSRVGATISYQISVNGTVVSPMSSANSYVWTPSAVGTYTIKFEYSDTKGNTNERSLTLTVADDSTLVKPIIKNVNPMNLNFIKLNTTATVKVLAGGGKTGTNLLFYKYVVTDPNGSKNIPYYTLKNSYSFVPKVKGTYTVEVFVQGSDNSTISKKYTYTADTNVPVTTSPVQM